MLPLGNTPPFAFPPFAGGSFFRSFDHQVDGVERRAALTEAILFVRELPFGYLVYPSVNDSLWDFPRRAKHAEWTIG